MWDFHAIPAIWLVTGYIGFQNKSAVSYIFCCIYEYELLNNIFQNLQLWLIITKGLHIFIRALYFLKWTDKFAQKKDTMNVG